MEIVATAHAEGSMHDFKLYTDSIGSAVHGDITVFGDSGYQGIKNLHGNSDTPKKKPKGGELSEEEKAANTRLSRVRISVEHVNAKFKVFKIIANKYRNRRNRFALRASLICGIINFENPKC